MSARSYWSIVAGMLLSILFINVYKHNRLVRKSYLLQALEEENRALTQTKNNVLAQLHSLKKPTKIKEFVEKKLQLKPLKPAQIVSCKVLTKAHG